MQNNDFLSQEYTIDTPENVTFGYEVVGIGSRFVAAVIDTIILFATLILLALVMLVGVAFLDEGSLSIGSLFADTSAEWLTGIMTAIYALINFVLFWGYYVLFELLWNGQTPGKRITKIRVVRTDGNPIGFLQSTVRNLVRFVDFMPTAYGFGLITMFFNKNSRRLGDFAAGTLVIRDTTEIGLDDLVGGSVTTNPQSSAILQPDAQANSYTDQNRPSPLNDAGQLSATMMAPAPEADPYLTQFANARVLSTNDYELMTDTLARHKANQLDKAMVTRLATAIAKKLDVELSSPYYSTKSTVQFLEDVTEAYRRLH